MTLFEKKKPRGSSTLWTVPGTSVALFFVFYYYCWVCWRLNTRLRQSRHHAFPVHRAHVDLWLSPRAPFDALWACVKENRYKAVTVVLAMMKVKRASDWIRESESKRVSQWVSQQEHERMNTVYLPSVCLNIFISSASSAEAEKKIQEENWGSGSFRNKSCRYV